MISGKKALITGAARGIGLAFATSYVSEGADVAIADINYEQAKLSAKAINSSPNSSGKSIATHMDVTKQDSIEQAVNEVISEFGHIDILINNAAIFSAAPIIEISREDYQRVFDINVSGTLFTLREVAKHMVSRGRGGKIINMASQAGRRGESLVGVYCASKAAIISLTQSAGLDLIKYKINVNAIAPGVVDGEHWDEVDAFFAKYEKKPIGQKKAEVGNAVPYGRMGKVEDLVGMAVFLASSKSDYIVSQCYNVDGGNWMS